MVEGRLSSYLAEFDRSQPGQVLGDELSGVAATADCFRIVMMDEHDAHQIALGRVVRGHDVNDIPMADLRWLLSHD
jgi:hypothetical protein